VSESIKLPFRLSFLILVLVLGGCGLAAAGPYADSAHGDAAAGVARDATSGMGYARGNCAHCHEQHASIGGSEPAPAGGGAEGFTLFAENFSGKAGHSYNQSDNVCFFCHTSSGSLQSGGVSNYLYSRTFGCSSSTSVSGILEAFNLSGSYHNLEDIRSLSASRFAFFKSQSNPCVACHNPHRARRNRQYPQDPLSSAVSRPTNHEGLWTASMGSSYGSEYEPPFCSGSSREPAGSSSAATGRANAVNYVAFCGDCHDSGSTIYSNSLGRNLQKIDWGSIGDKHGLRDRSDSSPSPTIKYPYNVSYDYVLSCMDCHEPHGSGNITLIRSRVNGGELSGTISTPVEIPPSPSLGSDRQMGYLCRRCHKDDGDFGYTAYEWKLVHHGGPGVTDAPYKNVKQCGRCHGGGPTPPIRCDKCHYHGATDAWLLDVNPSHHTGRRTF